MIFQPKRLLTISVNIFQRSFNKIFLMANTGLYCMAAMYIFTGSMHFITPRTFVRIMPPYIPWHYPLVYLSGAAEILAGLLLFWEPSRIFAAWALIALLIAVFPANVYMAQVYYRKKHRFLWLAIIRLPIQLVLIW